MLVTSQVLDEGIDVPAANVGIIPLGERLETPVRAAAAPHPATPRTTASPRGSTRSSPRIRWRRTSPQRRQEGVGASADG